LSIAFDALLSWLPIPEKEGNTRNTKHSYNIFGFHISHYNSNKRDVNEILVREFSSFIPVFGEATGKIQTHCTNIPSNRTRSPEQRFNRPD